MSPPVDAVPNDEQLPDRVDVAIIGGGVIGVSTAYFLARKGLSVAVLEKGRVAGEQSSRNWGWCRQQGRDEREIPLARESVRLWEELQTETGLEFGFRRTGVLYATEDESELRDWESWAQLAERYGLDTRLLGAGDTARLTPGTARKWIGGLHTPSDGRAEPSMAVPALARAARKLGVTIHQNCAARGFETKAGRAATVVTEKGPLHANSILCAGGAWSSLFCRRHGLRLPQLAVRSSVLRTEPAEAVTEGAIASQPFCVRRRLDGGYNLALEAANTLFLTPVAFRYFFAFLSTLRQEGDQVRIRLDGRFWKALRWERAWAMDKPGPFEEVRILDPEPDPKALATVLANFQDSFPELGSIKMAESWAGMIDVTPDAVPVISPVDSLPGFYLATGFSGHGFGIGPGAGRLAADLVAGDAPIVDPKPFAYTRMIDGTRLTPQPLTV